MSPSSLIKGVDLTKILASTFASSFASCVVVNNVNPAFVCQGFIALVICVGVNRVVICVSVNYVVFVMVNCVVDLRWCL